MTNIITPQELRIGNLVYDTRSVSKYIAKNIHTVGQIDIDKDYSHFEPIPLTPEILEKAGFTYKKCGISGADMWQGMDFWRYKDINFRGNIYTARGGVLHLEGYFNSDIEYLHQLQNLYFALTGEELEVNL